VDDLPDCADSLALFLRLSGYDAQTAYGGLTALARVQAQHPAVIILDINMPGMNGYTVAQRIRALPLAPRPWLIALTAYGSDEDRRRSQAAGFDVHLVKPVDPNQLQELFRQFQSNQAPSPGP
jgi:CheY-like chemotaxis protein